MTSIHIRYTADIFHCLFVFVVARQLQRPLEACVFYTAARGELHQDGGQPDKAGAHPLAHQRH